MIRALLFDFDGTILDTESCDYQAWQSVYEAYGFELPLEDWLPGFHGAIDQFDPHKELETRLGRTLQRHAIRHQHEIFEAECIRRQPLRPGVTELLATAREHRLKTAVVSSETRAWISSLLSRYGLRNAFDYISSADDTQHLKPEPDLYLLALEQLKVTAAEAIAIEDSPNGIRAAREAGLYCVAVPNPITSQFDLSQANVIIESLADISLDELINEKERAR
jgi:HAD superfamily hydrolase (TIGR01509 family)